MLARVDKQQHNSSELHHKQFGVGAACSWVVNIITQSSQVHTQAAPVFVQHLCLMRLSYNCVMKVVQRSCNTLCMLLHSRYIIIEQALCAGLLSCVHPEVHVHELLMQKKKKNNNKKPKMSEKH